MTTEERDRASLHWARMDGCISEEAYHAAFQRRPEASYIIGRVLGGLMTGVCGGLAIGGLAALIWLAAGLVGLR